jgi:hypothetical protein
MKNIKSRLSTWIGLLAVCLLPVGARAAEHYQSGIIGLVEETNTWNTIRVFDGKMPILVPIDADGLFVVDLKPGRYVVTPLFIPVAVPITFPVPPSYGTSIPVKVTGHHFTFVEITEPLPPYPPTGLPFLHGPQQPIPVHKH